VCECIWTELVGLGLWLLIETESDTSFEYYYSACLSWNDTILDLGLFKHLQQRHFYLKVSPGNRWPKIRILLPELLVWPQDSTTAAWIGGYPEGSQAGPVPVSTSGLGSGPTLANGQRCLSGFDLIKRMHVWPSCWSWTRLGHGNKGRRLELPLKSTSSHASATHWYVYIRSVYSTCHWLSSGQQHPGHQCCWTQTRHRTTNTNRETFISQLFTFVDVC